MPVSTIPVTLVQGFSPTARAAVLGDLGLLRTAEEKWAWLLQDCESEPAQADLLKGATLSPKPESPGSRMRLSNACVCCVGQAELQSQLPKLLRAGPWKRVVIELAPGSHPAKVIDYLRSKAWSTKLDIQQVLLAIDNESCGRYLSAVERHQVDQASHSASATFAAGTSLSPALGPSALHFLARAQLMASTHLVSVAGDKLELNSLRASFSRCDLLSELVCLNVDEFKVASSLEHRFSNSKAANQHARAHTSCNLGTDESNAIHFRLCWSPTSLFDRKRVMQVISTFSQAWPGANVLGIFATERAWYEWRAIDSMQRWGETEYRVCSFLRIESVASIALREQLSDLKIAIEQTIAN